MSLEHISLFWLIKFILITLALILIVKTLWKKVVVFEYQVALLYDNGVFKRILGPGAHHIWKFISTTSYVDMRKNSLTIASQEIITGDNVVLKLSLLVSYKIIDPVKALHTSQSWYNDIYALCQLAARDALSSLKIDDILAKRITLGSELLETVKPKASDLGIEIDLLQIKDLIFPADLRKVYSDVLKAQKEGQAALERARSEQAALRSLANAARILEGNPALMNLRVLQTISAQSGNNSPTIVLGVPQGIMPLQKGNGNNISDIE